MMLSAFVVFAGFQAAGPAPPSAEHDRPVAPLQQATVDERSGELLPLDLTFVDHRGVPVRLGDVVSGERPAILVLAYFDCRNLCSLVLQGVARAVRDAPVELGVDYNAVTVSIDPRDGPEDAREARSHVIAGQGSGVPAGAWPFLVGAEPAIGTLAAALGFGFAYDAASDQYAHPAVVFVIAPDGQISSHLYGTTFDVAAVETALRDARAGTVRASLHQVLLRCFRYVPALRRYGDAITLAFRMAGLVTVLILGGWLARYWWREGGRESP